MLIIEAFYQIVAGVVAVLIITIIYRFLKNISKFAKCILVLTTAVLFITACELIKFDQAKYLSMLLLGFMCKKVWTKKGTPVIETKIFWDFLKMFFFANVGAVIVLEDIKASDVGKGLIVVGAGTFIRWCATFITMSSF